MRSLASLILLSCGCLLLSETWAQEVQGEDAQEVTASDSRGVDNEQNDVAVAGVWHDDRLFVAMTTSGFLTGTDSGETDIAIVVFSSDLEEEGKKQMGGSGDDIITAISADDSLELGVVIVGSTSVASELEDDDEEEYLFDLDVAPGLTDWFIATLDIDLEVTNQYVNGTLFDTEEATAVAVDPNGEGYYVAGITFGDYFEENEGSSTSDVWLLKINRDLDPDFEWNVQFGTEVDDVPTALVVGDSGVYVIGTSRDNAGDLSSDEEEDIAPMFVYAFDPDGGDLWDLSTTEQLGTLSDGSEAHGAVLSEDESELFVAGHTEGTLPDYDGDSTDGAELFVMSIDTDDGSVNWVWQSESNATAFGTGGVVMADDGVSPIVGGIAFGNFFNLSFTYWENGNGDMIAAKIDPDELEVTKYFVAAAASTETREQPFAMVKDPDVRDGVFLIGQQDGEFEDEDVEPEEDPDSESGENYANTLVLKVKLEVFPEEEEEDTGKDYPYWYIGVPLFAVGGILFILAYKWSAASQRAKERQKTMV